MASQWRIRRVNDHFPTKGGRCWIRGNQSDSQAIDCWPPEGYLYTLFLRAIEDGEIEDLDGFK
jgi:hypothetical protein